MAWDWQEESRSSWHHESIPDKDRHLYVLVGALQRIATALEKIQHDHDPNLAEARALLSKEKAIRRAWYDSCSYVVPAGELIDSKLNGLSRGVKKKVRQHLLPYRSADDYTPHTAEEGKEALRIAEEFDPLVFDWSAIKITKSQRDRVAAWIGHHAGERGGGSAVLGGVESPGAQSRVSFQEDGAGEEEVNHGEARPSRGEFES